MKQTKLFAIFLTLVIFITSVLCMACNNGQTEKDDNNGEFEASVNYIVKDSSTEYKIVSSKTRDADEEMAVNWLRQLFGESTGITLDVVYDDEIATISDADKYILVGNNKFNSEKGVVADRDALLSSGYVIKTVGNSVFILGTTATSTIFGVNRFLSHIINYDYFYKNVYYVDKGVKDIKLYNYNLEFKPDSEFNFMEANYLSTSEEKYFSIARIKKDSINGTIGHNSIWWLPLARFNNPALPDEYHPDWYMTAKDQETTQLCYTAHGNKDEYALMVEQMRIELSEEMIAKADSYYFQCTISDDYNWCECDACKAAEKKYGQKSALIVRLLNDVAESVDKWFETDEGKQYKRNWYVSFYAYFDCTVPPVKYDEKTGTFTANDPSVFCNKHVIPQVADILLGDYTAAYDAEVNYSTSLIFGGWKFLCDNMATYLYSSDYYHDLLPFDNITVLQSWYKNLKGAQMYLHDHPNEMGFATGWSALRLYLVSKLGINVDINVEEHIEKFFKNVYADASDIMLRFFNEWRAHEAYNKSFGSAYAGKMSHYSSKPIQSKFFSAQLLKRWLGYIDQALEAVDYLRIDGDESYYQVQKMISGERIFVNYLLYKIYRYDRVNLPQNEYDEVKRVLVSDLRLLGVNYTGSSDLYTVDKFIENMMTEG